MLISFIVPVYNVEKYLDDCVKSIVSQTHRDVEVILVDDGSPDNCPKLCDEWAKKDNRIRVVHKPNGGLSDARNAGLKVAQGDYVVFIDSDDFWASEHCLEKLLEEVKLTPECDFIGFNCSYYYPSSNKEVKWVEYAPEIQNPIKPEDCIMKLVASGTFPMSACLKIFKRSALQNRIEFIKGIYSEDIPWFIELLKKSSCCRFVNQYIYMYRKEVNDSISSSFKLKKFTDILASLAEGATSVEKNWNKEANDALLSFWAYEYCILLGMLGYMSKDEKKVWLPKLLEYEWLLKYRLNPKVKLVAKIRSILGRRLTEILLYKYIRTRMS